MEYQVLQEQNNQWPDFLVHHVTMKHAQAQLFLI
jgi:hypothetical protein